MSEPSFSGPFGRGGGDTVRVRFHFHGTFTQDFEDFVRDRAQRLSVPVVVQWTRTEALVDAEGSDAMIGALEMAACLGPETCQIDWWVAHEL